MGVLHDGGTINLAEICGPLPSGSEYATSYHGSLVITIAGVLSFGEDMTWAAQVMKPTTTPSGRKGKPTTVLTLVGKEGETPGDLLRGLARMWELGEVRMGEKYADG